MIYDAWDEMERVYNDKKNWSYFHGADDGEIVGVYRRCKECGRYLIKGELFTNGFGQIRLSGWLCKNHGEQEPYFDRNIADYSE